MSDHTRAKYGAITIDQLVAHNEPYLTNEEFAALPPPARVWVENNWPLDGMGLHRNPQFAPFIASPPPVKPKWIADDYPAIEQAHRAQQAHRGIR